jgi:LCP family protein required for cell wall assembly
VPVLRIVIAVLAAWLVFLVVTPIWAWSNIARVKAEQPGASAKGTTFLVVGSDRRTGLTKQERREYGGGGGGTQRTDTIMLLRVPAHGEPTLVSLPRDSYVAIPGYGHNKINAAFSFGGPTLLVKTVQQATGMHIDGYVEVGFVGFVDVVNSVGGVHMCLKQPMKDKDAHVNLKAGCQTLNGAQALGFVRDRHSLANGDLGRVDNQRKLLAAITAKATSPATLLPWRYYGLLSAGSHSVTIGKKTSLWDVIKFGRAMRAVSSGHGKTTTVPIANANYMTSAGSSVLWDQAKAEKFFANLRSK